MICIAWVLSPLNFSYFRWLNHVKFRKKLIFWCSCTSGAAAAAMWAAWGKGGPGGGFGGHMGCAGQASATQVPVLAEKPSMDVEAVSHPWILAKELLNWQPISFYQWEFRGIWLTWINPCRLGFQGHLLALHVIKGCSFMYCTYPCIHTFTYTCIYTHYIYRYICNYM
jgi:hypothetical protein